MEREGGAIKVIRDSLPALDEWHYHEEIFFLHEVPADTVEQQGLQ